MKKWLIFVFPIFLASCFGPSNDEMQKAKDTLLNNTGATQKQQTQLTGTTNQVSNVLQEKSYVKITHLTSETFIDVKPIGNVEKIKDELDINGVVNNLDINKIVVSFKNPTSKFPSDTYDLKAYKKWSKEFLYRAYKKYQVLDTGLNTYTIDGYVWENLVSKVEIQVFLADPSKKTSVSGTGITSVPATFTGDILEVLPTDETKYGTPSVDKEQGIFTYSNLKDFVGTKNDEISSVTCENFADYLKENYTWYYWNTCRPITDENNFWVNVLSLTGDEYRYERHYITAKYGIYAKLLLETGSGMMQDELQAKNDELKTKTFDSVVNADALMKDMLR